MVITTFLKCIIFTLCLHPNTIVSSQSTETQTEEESITDILEKFVGQLKGPVPTGQSNDTEILGAFDVIKDNLATLDEPVKQSIEIKLKFHALMNKINTLLKVKDRNQKNIKEFFDNLSSICSHKKVLALTNIINLCHGFISCANEILNDSKSLTRKKIAKLSAFAKDVIDRIIIELENNYLISSSQALVHPVLKEKLPSKQEILFYLTNFQKSLKDLPIHVKIINSLQEYSKTSTTIGGTIITVLLAFGLWRSTRQNHFAQIVKTITSFGKVAEEAKAELIPTNRKIQAILDELPVETIKHLVSKVNILDSQKTLQRYSSELEELASEQPNSTDIDTKVKILIGLKTHLTEMNQAYPDIAPRKTAPIVDALRTVITDLNNSKNLNVSHRPDHSQSFKKLQQHIDFLKETTSELPTNALELLGIKEANIFPKLLERL